MHERGNSSTGNETIFRKKNSGGAEKSASTALLAQRKK